jgi:hypothetical protein
LRSPIRADLSARRTPVYMQYRTSSPRNSHVVVFLIGEQSSLREIGHYKDR